MGAALDDCLICLFISNLVSLEFVLLIEKEAMDYVYCSMRSSPPSLSLDRDICLVFSICCFRFNISSLHLQERFTCKDQKISENFYVRGDGTVSSTCIYSFRLTVNRFLMFQLFAALSFMLL